MTDCLRCGKSPGDQLFRLRHYSLERAIPLCQPCAIVASRITGLSAGILDKSASANWHRFKEWIEVDQPRGWLPYGQMELLLFFYPIFLIGAGCEFDEVVSGGGMTSLAAA